MGTSVFILGKLMLLGNIFPQVEEAVTVLLKYVNTKEQKKLNRLYEHDNILLILVLKKIPQKEKKPKKM